LRRFGELSGEGDFLEFVDLDLDLDLDLFVNKKAEDREEDEENVPSISLPEDVRGEDEAEEIFKEFWNFLFFSHRLSQVARKPASWEEVLSVDMMIMTPLRELTFSLAPMASLPWSTATSGPSPSTPSKTRM
jgi:hypothetical protein